MEDRKRKYALDEGGQDDSQQPQDQSTQKKKRGGKKKKIVDDFAGVIISGEPDNYADEQDTL